MPAVITSRLRKTAELAGLLVSVTVVFSSVAAIAGGLSLLTDPAATSAGAYGAFSQTDLAALERAVKAESNDRRLTEMDGLDQAMPAKDLTRLADPVASSAGSYGTFSNTDLAVLERVLNVESADRLLTDGGKTAQTTPAKRMRHTVKPEAELFPFSGSVMPLLVPRPDAVVQVAPLPQPGTIDAVGVPYPMLRRPTPAERAAR